MDVRLKIYKAAERTILANKVGFDISTQEGVRIDFSSALTPGATYEVVADFYTDAEFYLELRNGNTVVASLDDVGETLHHSAKTFLNAAGNVTYMTLYLVANRSGICNARVASLKVSRYVSYPDTDPRYIADKWEFRDTAMGERYLSFTAKSAFPIDWRINDYAVYRGQTYYLNNIPSCVQRGRSGDVGDSFTYENVKMDDEQGKLSDCMLLDVTPTTGDYIASEGTNYTGSSVFTLYCAESIVSFVDYDGVSHPLHLSPVEYVGGVIQANLNRLYPHDGWRVIVNPELPYLDDKVLSFNRNYIPEVLSMIHDEWDLDYMVIGRTIMIGFTLNNVTDDGEGNVLTFGYGRGYNTPSDDGKALFRIKRNINSSQKIVTRLRAMGSTKNMPYRYYNDKYGLPQTMFVSNLQLPDTFETPATKSAHNAQRDGVYGLDGNGYPNIRHVLGDSNDAYIDKEDDAANCNDGIREGAAFWDGSDSDLEEIYPTIREGTYLELRGAAIPDKDGVTGSTAYPNYGDIERIDEILAIDEQTTNIGDGILAASDVSGQQELSYNVARTSKTESVSNPSYSGNYGDLFTWKGEIVTLFTVDVEQSPGTYLMAASTSHVVMRIKTSVGRSLGTNLGYEMNLWEIPSDGSANRHLGTYQRLQSSYDDGFIDVILPDLPDLRDDMKTGIPPVTQVESITLQKKSTVRIIIQPMVKALNIVQGESITWSITSAEEDVAPTYVWKPTAASDLFVNQPFYLFIKDIGIDMRHLQTTGEDATIHFNTGQCGGMEFKFNPNNVEDAVIGNKKGWKLQINERFVDKTINVYYPNANSSILPGDQYVLLGIEFPELYIKLAEMRLLAAATQYLADNCETKYTYEPEVSCIYLQQNIDRCEAAGDITKSIYWNLYAGYKFTMHGIPAADGDPLPLIDNITIQNITIKEGEKPIPQVEIVLNDDLDQSTIKKLTTSVDRIYNTIFNVGGGGGIGATRLAQLLDTLVASPSEGQMLMWNGTAWENVDTNFYNFISSIGNGFANWHFRSGDHDEVDFTHLHPFADIVNRPNTLAGYGISVADALFAAVTAGFAIALKNPRYLWGNLFDGTADVDGAITIRNGQHTVTISVDEDGWLKINGDVYATGAVSSLGREQQ